MDDLKKLRRVLGYLESTRDTGITLKISSFGVCVTLYTDASYGVRASGKSHSGCVIIVDEEGPVHIKSSKQKIVGKSTTEAELIAL